MLIAAIGCVGPSPVVHREDAAITEDVQARLAADGQTKPFAIAVATTGGVVQQSPLTVRRRHLGLVPVGIFKAEELVLERGENGGGDDHQGNGCARD